MEKKSINEGYVWYEDKTDLAAILKKMNNFKVYGKII